MALDENTASADPQQGDIKIDLSSQPATFESVIYGPDGKLTLDGMHMAIRAGRSVLWNGRIIYRESDLPNEAQYAQGDSLKMARARDTLQSQMDALNAQLEQLGNVPADAHPALKSEVPSTSPGNTLVGGLGTGDTVGVTENEQAAFHIANQANIMRANSTVPEVPATTPTPTESQQDSASAKTNSGRARGSSSSGSSDSTSSGSS